VITSITTSHELLEGRLRPRNPNACVYRAKRRLLHSARGGHYSNANIHPRINPPSKTPSILYHKPRPLPLSAPLLALTELLVFAVIVVSAFVPVPVVVFALPVTIGIALPDKQTLVISVRAGIPAVDHPHWFTQVEYADWKSVSQ
jgi:hypothetical protein